MERKNCQNQKRTRDKKDEKKEYRKGKKPEFMSPLNMDNDSSYRDNVEYHELCDPFGVFDFPWLKEGAVFEVEDQCSKPEDVFACVDQIQDTFETNLDQYNCVQDSSLVAPPPLDGKESFEGDNLWSFRVDDLEPLDCIWKAVIDHPLDINVSLNKA